jgi:YebC/PmpR family DNA-binding regulatory protein
VQREARRAFRCAMQRRQSAKTGGAQPGRTAGTNLTSRRLDERLKNRNDNCTLRAPLARATEKGMAGHSKWANIKHKKAAADAKRGKVWTRLIKEIQVAARMGGGDIDSNPRLRLAVEKAYDANMPKDNVNRAIQRGVGGVDGANYEEIRYEGYGIGGAAVIVDTMTDNRTRTVAEVRHAFSKNGGNMGTDGSVSFMFDHVGQFLFAPGTPEDKLMEAALEAGADDVVTNDDGSIEVLCPPNDFPKVKAALEAAGFKAEVAEVTMKPQTEVEFTGDDAVKMQKLLDALENLDDVQEVYTNAAIADE